MRSRTWQKRLRSRQVAGHPQLVWIIPIIAALIGGGLAINSYLERGPTITISFKTADGLQAGKTKIKFKDVEIGTVTTIELSRIARRFS